MLDAAILDQLRALFADISASHTFVVSPTEHEQRAAF